LYAPQKAFKEILQNPKYIGPLLIIVLMIVANFGYTYALMSTTYVERILPGGSNKDEWTENSTLWVVTPGATVTDNYNDVANGTDPYSVYGNISEEFSINNSAQIWMQLNDIGSIDCSGPSGYENVSLRIKQPSPTISPDNVTIYLFSGTTSNYFYHSLTENFAQSATNIWNNLTIGLESGQWLSSSGADWSNIKGLKLEFTWNENSNITMLVDGLFFRGPFRSQLEIYGTSYLLNYALFAVMQFVITWVFISGLAYILVRGLGGKVTWKPLLILFGFVLVTIFVQGAISAAIQAASPTIRVPLEYFGTQTEHDAVYNAISEQLYLVTLISRFTQIAVALWTIALSILAVRLLTEFSWTKSFLVGAAAYVVTNLVVSFMIG
jgi:hypothetical protein